MYSDPVTPEELTFRQQLTSLLLISRTLMLKLFEFHLPARGAISLGDFHADRTNSVFCGKALVEAYAVAESQEWIGTSVCDSLAGHVDALVGSFSLEGFVDIYSTQKRWDVLRLDWDIIRYDVPCKQGKQCRWVINWLSAWNFGGPVRDDFFEQQMTGKDTVDRKYSNTLAYMEWFNRFVSGEGETG